MTKYLAVPLFAYAALASSSALADPAAGSLNAEVRASSLSSYQRVKAYESATAIFASEARNDAWASPVESSIKRIAASDLALLAPKAQVSGVTCQATICQLRIKRTDADDAAMQKALNMVPLARATVRTVNVDGEAIFFLLFDDGMRSPDKYLSWYRTTRAKRLAQLRSSPYPAFATPAVAKLPSE
jgi:hypothetical protein